MEIREATCSDAAGIAAIYNHYVETSTITFEEEAVPVEMMAQRIKAVQSSYLPWYLAVEECRVLGYAYATAWRSRSAYRYSAEVTVYLAEEHRGKGIANLLYRQLLPELKRRGWHAVLAGIALPNAASIALHEHLGFRKAAHLRQVGFKLEQWVDVGYWQLLLQNDAYSETGRS